MSIYVLSTPVRANANEFKIGRTIQSEKKLLSAYTRGLGNPHIILFKKSPEYSDYIILEKNILSKVSKYRIKNFNGNASEWVKIEIDILLNIINEEFENMSYTKISDKYIKTINDNKFITFHKINRLINHGLLKKPKYQRDLDESRVEKIYSYILTDVNDGSFMLGSIILSFRGGILYVIDGLHRIWAINRIMDRSEKNLKDNSISVILMQDLDIAGEKKVFKNINLSLPVDKIITHDDEIKKYVDVVEKLVNTHWKSFMKNTKGFTIPNININLLKHDLVNRNLVRHKIENGEVFTVDEYTAKILELNTYIGNQLKGPDSHEIYSRRCKSLSQLNNLSKNIIKCETTTPSFYLGLVPKNRWVDFIFSKETF